MPSPSDGEEKVVRRRRAPARTVANGEETPVVKKPRKTAVRKAPVKRTTRKVTPREVEEIEEEEREDKECESVDRKAPTPIRGEKLSQQQRKKRMIIVGAIVVIGIGASAAVGFTDKGQIDINQTIEDRNERVRNNNTDERDENTSLVEVPVQSSQDGGKSAGGFIGVGSVEPELPKVVEEVSSTTDQTSSSTESTASDLGLVDENEDKGEGEVSPEAGNNPETEEAPTSE